MRWGDASTEHLRCIKNEESTFMPHEYIVVFYVMTGFSVLSFIILKTALLRLGAIIAGVEKPTFTVCCIVNVTTQAVPI